MPTITTKTETSWRAAALVADALVSDRSAYDKIDGVWAGAGNNSVRLFVEVNDRLFVEYVQHCQNPVVGDDGSIESKRQLAFRLLGACEGRLLETMDHQRIDDPDHAVLNLLESPDAFTAAYDVVLITQNMPACMRELLSLRVADTGKPAFDEVDLMASIVGQKFFLPISRCFC